MEEKLAEMKEQHRLENEKRDKERENDRETLKQVMAWVEEQKAKSNLRER